TLLGLQCDIYMGVIDIAKEKQNVTKMKILGANIIPVKSGLGTLKEAVDEAFIAYLKDTESQFYAIGSVVGPHPFPMMVRDFQSIVGKEAREQFLELEGKLPEKVIACVGGGSNAIGIFSGFINDKEVELYGIEPAGKSLKVGENAATMTIGKPGIIHGFKCYLIQNENGEPAPVYSVASGLDYPGVGPEHSYLKDTGRVKYEYVYDNEVIDAFFEFSRVEGIIPALESSHAIAFAIKQAKELSSDNTILVNLSGRGDKDIDFIVENYSHYL
ncbi:MAG: pyridoxal-phosphate dependent enzyme, partial [Candidatus Gastranaerophilales bacterium]|nr:pyridoxal-phosphate dependent enzyme [Candidatus Gastranaerophilales bacterium]